MRIIAGALKGRQFDSPRTERTHPMSEKARGALFNVLGDIQGLTVLDAFAGSGALSFEAVSRGAAAVTAIDSDKQAQKVIAQNIRALHVARHATLINAATNAWLATSPSAEFDIILCDPPYNDTQEALIGRLGERVKPGGLLVLSWPAEQSPPQFAGLTLLNTRTHGDAQLVFYRRLG